MKICALCREPRELCKSHLIPAKFFRQLKSKNSLVVIATDKTFSTSREIKEPLLCEDCERRFNDHESPFIRYAIQDDGSFPLQTELFNCPIVTNVKEGSARFTNGYVTFDQTSIAYFALSVFWRGSVGKWEYEGRLPIKNDLGAKYEEIIRRYLLGELPFPANARLFCAISPSPNPTAFLHIPISTRWHGYHSHRFSIPGFMFVLNIGNFQSDDSRNGCIIHNVNRPMYLLDWVDKIQEKDMINIMQNSIPVGSLSNK